MSTTWHEKSGKWEVVTDNGETILANIIVGATGGLHVPHVPSFPGQASLK